MQDKELRAEYVKRFGKKPGPAWTNEQIRLRLETQPEYKEEKPEPVSKPIVEKPDEETITMTKSKFREMMMEAQEETKKEQKQYKRIAPNQWEEAKDEKPIKKATFRVYQNEEGKKGIIISLKRAPYAKFIAYQQNKDIPPEKRDLYEVTVLYEDGEQIHEMALHDVSLITEFETVDIIETKARKMIQRLGKIRKAQKNSEGYTMSAGIDSDTDNIKLGEWVDEQITRMEETHTIRRPNGQIMEISNDKLNL
jgi:hypothetical protein